MLSIFLFKQLKKFTKQSQQIHEHDANNDIAFLVQKSENFRILRLSLKFWTIFNEFCNLGKPNWHL